MAVVVMVDSQDVERLKEADSSTDPHAIYVVDPRVDLTAVPPELEEPGPSAD